jgi:uncharacterized protein (DUF952 family)
MMKTILVIARKSEWEKSQASGEYIQSTIDSSLADIGFIHCSFPNQTLDIANHKYAENDNLVLLFVDEDKVNSTVKHEGALSGRSGTFPHIYGPLNVSAVYKSIDLKKDEQGLFIAPDELKKLVIDRPSA